jgi:hypothetical protein
MGANVTLSSGRYGIEGTNGGKGSIARPLRGLLIGLVSVLPEQPDFSSCNVCMHSHFTFHSAERIETIGGMHLSYTASKPFRGVREGKNQ